MLGTIRDNWHKSKAAVIVEKALSQSHLPMGGARAASFANGLVEGAWEVNAVTFSHRNPIRPNPVSIAAMSLAFGIGRYSDNKIMRWTSMGGLQALLKEINENMGLYSLNGLDLELIEFCQEFLSVAFDEEPDEREPAKPDGNPSGQTPQQPAHLDVELSKRAGDLDARLAAARKR